MEGQGLPGGGGGGGEGSTVDESPRGESVGHRLISVKWDGSCPGRKGAWGPRCASEWRPRMSRHRA